MPFSRLTGEYESSIIQQSMLLQCHSRSQSLEELISIVAVTMIFRPQILCKGIMKRKPLKTYSCFAMMYSWICCSLSDKCRCYVASMSTPYGASCSVEMVSFRRLDFLSVCQSVCSLCSVLQSILSTTFTGLWGWGCPMKLFGERRNFAWWLREDIWLLLQLHLIWCCTHVCLLSATYVYVGLLVSSAFSFFLKKFFMASLVRLFRFFCTVHQQLCQCLKMKNIRY